MNSELKQWLADFDSGKEVTSLLLTAMGTSFELELQVVAIRIMRTLQDIEVPNNEQELNAALDKELKGMDFYKDTVADELSAHVAIAFWKYTPKGAIAGWRKKPTNRFITFRKRDTVL